MTSSIKVHHLNCGTVRPLCRRLINGSGSMLERAEMVCHCLLLETLAGLVLVDSGLGIQDVKAPQQRLGRVFNMLANPRLKREEIAFEQVRALGYDPSDVHHIIPTHLDLDHAGGLSDFPRAQIHVNKAELTATQNSGFAERFRYRAPQFEHGPYWTVHDRADDEWYGFEVMCPLPTVGEDLLMVQLPGHTRGHVGVAARQKGRGWLLHCGDAYFHHGQLTPGRETPAGIRAFERIVQTLPQARRNSLAKLQQLASENPEVRLLCSHDPVELAHYTGQ